MVLYRFAPPVLTERGVLFAHSLRLFNILSVKSFPQIRDSTNTKLVRSYSHYGKWIDGQYIIRGAFFLV